MPRKTVSKAEPKTHKEKAVWQACDALQSKDKAPTYLAIGEQLVKMGYKRGSNSDIRRYLNSWKEQTPTSRTKQSTVVNPVKKQPIEFSPQLSLDTLLKLYYHHSQQIDRLMHIIELHRDENRLLRKKLDEALQKAKVKPRLRVKLIATPDA